MIKLWSKRYTPAKGWHWRLERECADETAAAWYLAFKNDEPGTRFAVAKKKPKT